MIDSIPIWSIEMVSLLKIASHSGNILRLGIWLQGICYDHGSQEEGEPT
jgi:hypothetical protein